MSLASRLVAARKAKKISQAKLAEIVGCGQQSIHAIEEGRSLLPRKIEQIAAALNTTPDYLLYGRSSGPDPFANVDPELRDLLLTAGRKIAAPGLDADVRNTAISALRMLAKQDVAPYDNAVPAHQFADDRKPITGGKP